MALQDSEHRHVFLIAICRPAPATLAVMPEIARFFGLVIQMYLRDHDPPHFHVRYGSFRARIGIAPVKCLSGYLPPRPLAMVLYWASLHQAELAECWHRIQHGEPPRRVAPLE